MKNNLPEFNISLKYKGKKSELKTISSSNDAADIARMCFDADTMDWTESFIVIALNNANKVLGFYKVSSGGVTATIADPKVIFQFALLSNASSILVAHNHPSGNLQPSNADKAITEKIANAAKLLDMRLLDHIIITDESHFSFQESGLL